MKVALLVIVCIQLLLMNYKVLCDSCQKGQEPKDAFPVTPVTGGQYLAKCFGPVFVPNEEISISRFGITGLVVNGGDTSANCTINNMDSKQVVAKYSVTDIQSLPKDSYFFYYDMPSPVTLDIGTRYLTCCYLDSMIGNAVFDTTIPSQLANYSGEMFHSSSGYQFPEFSLSGVGFAYYNMLPILGSVCVDCEPGEFSDTINTQCTASFCNATTGCGTNGTCVGVNKCECQTGFYGDTCTQCPTGCTNCTSASQCSSCEPGYILANGICSIPCLSGCGNGFCSNGLCVCNPGYYGSVCDSRCSTGCGNCTNSTAAGCTGCLDGYYGDTCGSLCATGCAACNSTYCSSCVSGYFFRNGRCIAIVPQTTGNCTYGQRYVPEFPLPASTGGQYLAKCIGFVYTPVQTLTVKRFGITQLVIYGGDQSTSCSFFETDTKKLIGNYTVNNITLLPSDENYYYYDMPTSVTLNAGVNYLSCCYLHSMIGVVHLREQISDRVSSVGINYHSSSGYDYPQFDLPSHNAYYNMMPVLSSNCESCGPGKFSDYSHIGCAQSFCNATTGCGTGECLGVNKCKCGPGFFGNQCFGRCQKGCNNCTSSADCFSCESGYIMVNGTCRCPTGYYGTNCAQQCVFPCSDCYGPLACSACADGYFLKNGVCQAIEPQVMQSCTLGQKYNSQFPIVITTQKSQALAKCVGFIYTPAQRLTISRFGIVSSVTDTSTTCSFYDADTRTQIATFPVANLTSLPKDSNMYYYDMPNSLTLEAGKRYISCCYMNSLIGSFIEFGVTSNSRILSIGISQHSSLGTGYPEIPLDRTNNRSYYNMMPVLSSTCTICPTGAFSDSNNLGCATSFCNSTTGCGNNGKCIGVDECECNTGFFGQKCSSTAGVLCFGVAADQRTVCSGHGTCDATDSCTCNSAYTGARCETLKPNPCIAPGSTVECSGYGACEGGVCNCYKSTALGFHNGTFCTSCSPPYVGANCRSWTPQTTATFTEDMGKLIAQSFTTLSFGGCSALIHPSNLNLFGTGSKCSISNNQLTITLGSNPQIQIGSKFAINILAGETTGSPLFVNMTTAAPLNPIPPTVKISTQPVVGFCSGVRLDGSQSVFPDGRAGTFAWSCKTGSNCEAINQLSLNSPIVDIDSSLITSDSTYTFALRLTSVFGLTADSTATVSKSKQPVITATIPGEKEKQLSGAQNIIVANVAVQCANSTVFNYVMKWEQTSGPLVQFASFATALVIYRRQQTNPAMTVGFKFSVLNPTTQEEIASDTVTLSFYLQPLKLVRSGEKYVAYETFVEWYYLTIDPEQTSQQGTEEISAKCIYNSFSCDSAIQLSRQNRVLRITSPPQQYTPMQFTITYTYKKGDRTVTDVSTVEIGPATGVRFVLNGYSGGPNIYASSTVYSSVQGQFAYYLNDRQVYPATYNYSVPGYLYTSTVTSLKADDVYGVEQRVRIEFVNSIGSGSAEFSFTLPAPPRPGSIMINPSQGYDLDKFVFTAASWIDENQPLTYSWVVLSNVTLVGLSPASDSNQWSVYLPAKPEPFTVHLTVTNRLGAVSTMTSQVLVQTKPNVSDEERLSSLNSLFEDSTALGTSGPGFLQSITQIGALIFRPPTARKINEEDPSQAFVTKLINTLRTYATTVDSDMIDQSYFEQIAMNVFNMLNTGYTNSTSRDTLFSTIEALLSQSEEATVTFTSNLYSPLLGALDSLLSLGSTANTKDIMTSIVEKAAAELTLGDSIKFNGKEVATMAAKLSTGQLTNYDTSLGAEKQLEVTLLAGLTDLLVDQASSVNLKVDMYSKARIDWINSYNETTESQVVSPVIVHTVTDDSGLALNITTDDSIIRFKYTVTGSRSIQVDSQPGYEYQYRCKQLDDDNQWSDTSCKASTSSGSVQCECSRLSATVVTYDYTTVDVPVDSSDNTQISAGYKYSASWIGSLLTAMILALVL